jgi:hypothetical protein
LGFGVVNPYSEILLLNGDIAAVNGLSGFFLSLEERVFPLLLLGVSIKSFVVGLFELPFLSSNPGTSWTSEA